MEGDVVTAYGAKQREFSCQVTARRHWWWWQWESSKRWSQKQSSSVFCLRLTLLLLVNNSLALHPYTTVRVITWWPLFHGILELLVQNNQQRDTQDQFLSQWCYQSFGVGSKMMSSGKIMENNGGHVHLINQERIKYWINNKTMSKESLFKMVQNVLDF